MLIRLARDVIYNGATGDWIRYPEEQNTFLLFYPLNQSTYQHRLTGEEAQTAWCRLCAIASAERRVLEHQQDEALEYGITSSFE